MKSRLLIILLIIASSAKSVDSFYGFTGGLSFSFGTHSNRIGLSVSAYYTYGFAQVNAQIAGFYNFQTLGTKMKSPELQMGIGAEFGWGRKKDSIRNEFVGLGENNMEFPYSIGYSFIRYQDKIETSQSSGIMTLNIQDFRLLTENDLFGAGQGWRDRFRTGAFLIEYQYENFKFATNCILWTGDYSRSTWIKDAEYPLFLHKLFY